MWCLGLSRVLGFRGLGFRDITYIYIYIYMYVIINVYVYIYIYIHTYILFESAPRHRDVAWQVEALRHVPSCVQTLRCRVIDRY